MTSLPRRANRCCPAAVAGLAAICSALAGPATAATLSEIVKRDAIVMCAQADALPHSQQGAGPQGFQIELGRALADELGVPLRVHFLHLHREPRRNECDLLMAVPAPKTPDPEAGYRISRPYMVFLPVLVVPRTRPPTPTLTAFAPGRVAVESGSWAHFLLVERNIPVWVRFTDDEQRIRAVETGEAAAAIVSNFGYGWYRYRFPDAQVRAASEVALDDDLGFDVAVGLIGADDALLGRVNAALARLAQSGQIARILSRYGIELSPPGEARTPSR